MSYDLYLKDPVTKETLHAEAPHHCRGGNYVMGGTTELHLNVTYNYSRHYYRVMGEEGLRSIYGKSGAEAIPILLDAISKLSDEVDPDYWMSTEGNAKRALHVLLAFSRLRPDGVWDGD